MTTTAQVFYEAHHRGFNLTVRRAGAQLFQGHSLTEQQVVQQVKLHGATSADVTVLPAQP